MGNYDERGEPTRVTRDAGISKRELISPENRNKARERALDPNVVTGKYKLKELLGEMGIIVHPERMTNWYAYNNK